MVDWILRDNIEIGLLQRVKAFCNSPFFHLCKRHKPSLPVRRKFGAAPTPCCLKKGVKVVWGNRRGETKVERKFKERYLAGEIEFEAIDDYSYEWGISEETCTLREYLGLNEEEEDAWVSIGEEALYEMLEKQKG